MKEVCHDKKSNLETMDFTKSDYKEAIKESYRHRKNEFIQFENTYKGWSQSTQIYALSTVDSSGRPIDANIEAYNQTIMERKRLAIRMKLLEREIKNLEAFWVDKGFDITELQATNLKKELRKTSIIPK